jgi:hypothetical protein
MSDQICKVCAQPLAAHVLTLRDGVAHTAVAMDGRMQSCSKQDANYNWYWADVCRLNTIIRSLRYRAGRLRSKGGTWDAHTIYNYTKELARYRGQSERAMSEDFPWAC